MLQKTYSIYSDDLSSQQLFIEIGNNHLACWCKKPGEKKFTAFEFFQCEDYDASTFEHLISQVKLYSKLLMLDVADKTIVWLTDKKLVFPASLNVDENFIKDNFMLVYGNGSNSKFITRNYEDYLEVTSVENYLFNAVRNVFPKADFQPAYQIGKSREDVIRLFLYPNYFSAIVFKDEKLQFFQTKFYTNPEDILYVLSNVIHQYQIDKTIKIETGGFIDEHSKLFDLLYQYFEGLQLGTVNESLFVSSEFKDYPQHYFLPYVNYLS